MRRLDQIIQTRHVALQAPCLLSVSREKVVLLFFLLLLLRSLVESVSAWREREKKGYWSRDHLVSVGKAATDRARTPHTCQHPIDTLVL